MPDKIIESTGNVFEDLGFDEAEACAHLLRTKLMIDIEKRLRSQKRTQKAWGETLKIAQSRVSDLLKGKSELFSLDMLVTLAERSGLKIDLKRTEPLQSAGGAFHVTHTDAREPSPQMSERCRVVVFSLESSAPGRALVRDSSMDVSGDPWPLWISNFVVGDATTTGYAGLETRRNTVTDIKERARAQEVFQ